MLCYNCIGQIHNICVKENIKRNIKIRCLILWGKIWYLVRATRILLSFFFVCPSVLFYYNPRKKTNWCYFKSCEMESCELYPIKFWDHNLNERFTIINKRDLNIYIYVAIIKCNASLYIKMLINTFTIKPS